MYILCDLKKNPTVYKLCMYLFSPELDQFDVIQKKNDNNHI